MPIDRLTVPKTVWIKLNNGKDRKGNDKLKAALLPVNLPKISKTSAGDTVLWEPPEPLLRAAHAYLVHERQFARNKTSCSYAAMQKFVAICEKRLPDLVVVPPEGEGMEEKG